MSFSFYLDENMPLAFARKLRKTGMSVQTSKEACMLGETDEAQLKYAIGKKMVLMTRDIDFQVLHRSTQHAGIMRFVGPFTDKDNDNAVMRVLAVVENHPRTDNSLFVLTPTEYYRQMEGMSAERHSYVRKLSMGPTMTVDLAAALAVDRQVAMRPRGMALA